MLEVEKEGGRLLLYKGRTALGKTGEAEARLETRGMNGFPSRFSQLFRLRWLRSS